MTEHQNGIRKLKECVEGTRAYYERFIGSKHVVKSVADTHVWLGIRSSSGDREATAWYPSEIEVAESGPVAPPKFILQYELDKDPFEFFATEKEARKRIAELAERADLKRDSIRLIEIKKIRTVKLGTKITISK